MLVIDTNIWISYVLNRQSNLGRTVAQILGEEDYALSEDCFTELTHVLIRNKFDRFASMESRKSQLALIAVQAKWFIPTKTITACRDSKDNKFLELALAASASHILTGDEDLLCLDPFRDIRITTLAKFSVGR